MGTISLIITAVLITLILIAGLVWAVKTGMFTNVEDPKYRMMDEDDDVKGE